MVRVCLQNEDQTGQIKSSWPYDYQISTCIMVSKNFIHL
jgi:hypothetical protein